MALPDYVTAQPSSGGGLPDYVKQAAPQAPPAQEAPQPTSPSMGSQALETASNVAKVYPAVETAANLVTGAVAMPLSGLAGIFAAPFGKSEEAISKTQEALTYQPKTAGGQQLTQAVTYPLQKLEQGAEFVGNKLAEAGHPGLATAAHTGIVLSPALLGARMGKTKPVKNALIEIDLKTDTAIKNGINKAIRPSVAKKSTSSQVTKYHEQAASAVKEIVKNKDNLNLIDETGAAVEGLPKNLDQFSQAIEQTKRGIFEEYDSLAKLADEAGTAKTYTDAPMKGAEIKTGQPVNVKYAHNKSKSPNLGAEFAQDIEPTGKYIAPNSGKYITDGLEYGTAEFKNPIVLEHKTTRHGGWKTDLSNMYDGKTGKKLTEAIKKDGHDGVITKDGDFISESVYLGGDKGFSSKPPTGVQIDLGKTSKQLEPVINNKALQDLSPETIQYAEARIKSMEGRGQYSAVEAQEAIQLLNQTLDKFYRDPSPAMKGQALVDSTIANGLRKQLDSAISKSTGKEYQAIKKKYGDMKSIESEVTKRSIVDARKNNKGLLDFSDVFSGHQVVTGMLRADPVTMAAGGASKAVSAYYKMLNNPNKIVKNMFSGVEKMGKKRTSIANKPESPINTGAVAGTVASANSLNDNEPVNALYRGN